MFGYYYYYFFKRIVFKNIKKIILMFLKNYFCYSNFMFYICVIFFKEKKN